MEIVVVSNKEIPTLKWWNLTTLIMVNKTQQMKATHNEKPINPIIVHLCRGLAQYDANEIMQQATDTRTEYNKGYDPDCAD